MNIFEKLWENAPSPMCVLEGPDHEYTYANKAYKELIGKKDFLNHPVKRVLPEVASQGYIEILDRVYATGEAYHGDEVPVVIYKKSTPHNYYLNFIYQPISDDNGSIFGIFVQVIDVTKQVELRKDKEILLQELHHRVRNNLALILGLNELQANEITKEECLTPFKNTQNRIGTFAKVHHLTYSQQDLKQIPIHQLCEHYREYDNPVIALTIKVDELYVNINQAIPLGLICNEILTWFKNRLCRTTEAIIKSELTYLPEVDLIFIIRNIDTSVNKKQLLWDNTSFEGRLIHLFAKQLKANVEVSSRDSTITVHVKFTKADISGSGADIFL